MDPEVENDYGPCQKRQEWPTIYRPFREHVVVVYGGR